MTYDVYLHEDFHLGTNNDDETVTDLGSLTPVELRALATWMIDVAGGVKKHRGRNKESWIYSDGREVPNRALYKNGNCWHYHCGPFPAIAPLGRTMTNPDLPRNILGETSAAIYHYVKVVPDIIVIFGVTRKHSPFVDPNDKAVIGLRTTVGGTPVKWTRLE